MEILTSIILGLVEGITEFLPISSTGHLIVAGHLLGFEDMIRTTVADDVAAKKLANAFEVVIQLGAILAVVAAYPRRFLGLLRFRERGGFHGLRGLTLLVITSIPAALVGFLAHDYIDENLFSPLTVAAALAVGALWILLTERYLPRTRKEGVDSLTWREALAVGLFQCVSLWPGMSRAAATILGGMTCGVERKTATEYSFFAAVPIMVAATGYKIYKTYSILNASHVAMFAVGFVVSFLSAWVAVKFFIHFLSHHTLVPFGWYRLIVAALVVWWVVY
jgi:undecaprenyl-diphosphatase